MMPPDPDNNLKLIIHAPKQILMKVIREVELVHLHRGEKE